MLGNNDTWIYEDADNIDENFQEFALLPDMEDHFDTVFTTLQSLDELLFFEMDASDEQIWLETAYRNSTLLRRQMGLQTLKDYVEDNMRQMLLMAEFINITIPLGQTQQLQDIRVHLVYTVQKKWLLKANIHPQMKPRLTEATTTTNISRYFAIVTAAAIILFQALELIDAHIARKQFTTKQYWSCGIVFMSLIVMFDRNLSMIFAICLILPFLQQTGNQYLFSFSLRYALPIIMALWSNVIFFLNGLILYSILVYPSVMFENYKMSFFSYIYNNFQYATYEIFFEIKDHGIVGYILYMALYFYMVLVAHSLIPSVCCALVRFRNAQKNLKLKLKELETSCPMCGQYEKDSSTSSVKYETASMNITIQSPKLSPFIEKKNLQSFLGNINNTEMSEKGKHKVFIIEQQLQLRRKQQTQLIYQKIAHCDKMVQQSLLETSLLYRQEHEEALIKKLKHQYERWKSISTKAS